MNTMRRRLAQPVYLTAITVAMVGWVWMLVTGLQWMLGT